MRILTIAPTPYFSDRGCHVRIYEEARALVRSGHQVTICTYHLGRDMAELPTVRIPLIPWYKKHSAGPSWHKPFLDLLLFFKAWQLARKFNPQIIHAHLHEGAFIGRFLKPLLGIPLVFDCQGSLTGELLEHRFIEPGSLMYRVFLRLERWINDGADRILTSSGPTAELLKTRFLLSHDKVMVALDGVDIVDFAPATASDRLRVELGLPAGRPVVVFLGAMSEQQGVDLLLEAIVRIKENGTNAHFLLMGYPDGTYRAKAVSLGIGESVTFTGKIEYSQASQYLNLGSIAVSAKISTTEANGKLFNYMACGLATVVFDSPVNREILGKAGVYAKFGDSCDLADQVAGLLTDPSRCRALGEELRRKAVAEYSWAANARLITNVSSTTVEEGL